MPAFDEMEDSIFDKHFD